MSPPPSQALLTPRRRKSRPRRQVFFRAGQESLAPAPPLTYSGGNEPPKKRPAMTTTCCLHRIAEGEPSAMDAFLAEYNGLIWSLARRHSPTAQDAEDAVQEILLEIWRSAGRFDPELAAEKTFVAMIARRRLIDRGRKQARRPKTEALIDESMAPEEATTDLVEVQDEVQRVAEVLGKLRPEQQKVIEMSFVEGQTHSEISEATGMPLGTVKSLARRGLMKVRQQLGLDEDGAAAPSG